MLRTLLLLLILTPFQSHALTLQDRQENEYQVEVLPAEGDLVTLWFSDLVDDERPHFDALLESLPQHGIEVWKTRVLRDLFLTRDDHSIMSLDGSKIAAIIDAAHQQTKKKILIVSYDKISIPVLRGVRYWQQHYTNREQVSGVALLYPNLFIAPTRAGDQPSPAPILSLTNVPVALFQPEQGQHAKRISLAMEQLWDAGSTATLIPLSNIRDWFIMHKPGKYPAEAPARKRLPKQLLTAVQQMQFSPFPQAAAVPQQATAEIEVERDPYRLIPISERPKAPDFTLLDNHQTQHNLKQLQGKVVLVNFWASWCPPCIEEMPSMNRIYQRYREQGLEMLGINFQEEPQQIIEFLKKVKVDFPVLFDQDGAVAHQWNVFSMPTSFLVNRKGEVVYSVSRSIHWDLPEHEAVLQQLLAE